MNGSKDYVIRPISRSNNKTVVLTMGDPRGIGPEVIRKALRSKSLLSQASFIVIGDKNKLRHLHPSVKVVDVKYRSAGEAALKFLDHAIDLIKKGQAHALVTAPLSKEAVSHFAKDFVGHTEYLAK